MGNKVKFEDLAEIGWMFDLQFNLPPFDGYADECFFDVDEFKHTPDFQKFIGMINDTNIPYEYAKTKGGNKIFLTIKTGDMHGFRRSSKRTTH